MKKIFEELNKYGVKMKIEPDPCLKNNILITFTKNNFHTSFLFGLNNITELEDHAYRVHYMLEEFLLKYQENLTKSDASSEM